MQRGILTFKNHLRATFEPLRCLHEEFSRANYQRFCSGVRKNQLLQSFRATLMSLNVSVTIALFPQQVAVVREQLGGHVHEIVFMQTTPRGPLSSALRVSTKVDLSGRSESSCLYYQCNVLNSKMFTQKKGSTAMAGFKAA